MKEILPFIISLLILPNIWAQDLVGKWNINSLINNNLYPPTEYILSPTKSDQNGYNFGLILNLKSDGTFHSYRIPGCGQDRFPPSTYGKYTIIDDNYISFFLEKSKNEHETIINEDLGKFYYTKKANGYRFIKSSGNIDHDKQIIYFRDLLYEKNDEINKYEDNLLDWKYTKIQDKKEAVSFCLSENKIENSEILYSRHAEGYNRTIFLIKVKNNFKFVVFEKGYHRKDLNRIALYDDSKIKEIDKLVAEINNDKKLKIKTIEDNNESNQSNNSEITLKVYQKKKKIYKAVYEQYTPYSEENGNINNLIIYYQGEKPIYVEYLVQHISEKQEPESITGFYILDYDKQKIITKSIKSKNYRRTSYPTGLMDKVMDKIKN